MPEKVMTSIGVELQEPVIVGRAAAYLMADEKRKGQGIHVAKGRYQEIEESIMLPAAEKVVGVAKGEVMEDEILAKVIEAMGVFRGKPGTAQHCSWVSDRHRLVDFFQGV
jgi:hypothetical protein